MRRHDWEQGVCGEIEQRYKELTSVASLARRDIDRHLWLSECRPDLAVFAPWPPPLCGRITYARDLAGLEKKKSAARRGSQKKGLHHHGDGVGALRLGGQCDPDKLSCGMQENLQRLLEFVTTLSERRSTGDAVWSSSPTQQQTVRSTGAYDLLTHDCHKPTLAWLRFDHKKPASAQSRQTQITEAKPRPVEDGGRTLDNPTNFASSSDRTCSPTRKTSSGNFARMTSRPSTLHTGAKDKVLFGSDMDTGPCRDVAIQTGRIILPMLPGIPQEHEQPQEEAKPDSFQISVAEAAQAAVDLQEHDLENIRAQFTVKILEKWAEPLQQYLGTLQEFEQELRNRWLSPQELELVTSPKITTADLNSRCAHHGSRFHMAAVAPTERVSQGHVQIQCKKVSKKRPGHTEGVGRSRGEQGTTLKVRDETRKKPEWQSPLRRPQAEYKTTVTKKVVRKSLQRAMSQDDDGSLRRIPQPALSLPRQGKKDKKHSKKMETALTCAEGLSHECQELAHDKKRNKNAEGVALSATSPTSQRLQHNFKRYSGREGGGIIYKPKRPAKSRWESEVDVAGWTEKLADFPALGDGSDSKLDMDGLCGDAECDPAQKGDGGSLRSNGRENKMAEPPQILSELQVVQVNSDEDKARKELNQAGVQFRRRVERLADSFIDGAVNEVALELAAFCDSVVEQMYTAEFLAV